MTKPSVRATDGRVSEEERLRADLYGLLGSILSAPPDRATLDALGALSGDGSAIGQGVSALAAAARATEPASARREYERLFIGVGRGELLPYASFYLTGFLNEKPLAKLRDHMRALGIARVEEVREPEDHIASLCEMMAGLIRGTFGAPASLADQEAFFNTHLAPWAGHFFADLESAKSSAFYAPVGTIGRAFVDIEIEAFRMGP